MVHPKTGRVYVDKNEDGGRLRVQARLSTSGTNIFRPVATIDLWVTDGAFSPDGQQLVVRGYFGGMAHAWNNGKPKNTRAVERAAPAAGGVRRTPRRVQADVRQRGQGQSSAGPGLAAPGAGRTPSRLRRAGDRCRPVGATGAEA